VCAALAAALPLLLAALAGAQRRRPFPATALRGELVITQPPEVLLNGAPARLAPGARIRGATTCCDCRPRWPAEAAGALHARAIGLVQDVWVLTPDEAARKPWPTTPKKVYIRTFGCQMNEYDSDKMADVLRAAEGYEPTNDPEQADLILFNTCSVREKAQEKVFSDLGRVKHLKNKGVLIGVGGCVASQEGAAIIERAPYVDVVFGPQTLHRLPQMLARAQQQRPQVDISFPEIEKFDHLPPARVEGASAFVSIMEGCSKYCSYCVVPYTRGEEVSPPVRRRADRSGRPGRPGRQGSDAAGPERQRLPRRWATRPRSPTFALLLEYVAEIPGIERIRYTTSHPNEFTQRLIDVYGKLPQAGEPPAPAGAARLRPHPDGDEARLHRTGIQEHHPQAARRAPRHQPVTDFIVGFPGETDDDFAQDDEADRRRRVRRLFSFIFSPRPGTPAANLPTTPRTRSSSSACSSCRPPSSQRARISASRVGTVQRILVEGPSPQGPQRADGPHRVQPHRQLRRRPAPRRARWWAR
jgi:tRNA-2-methylthio-N6-dimethylallyladenosine synthase